MPLISVPSDGVNDQFTAVPVDTVKGADCAGESVTTTGEIVRPAAGFRKMTVLACTLGFAALRHVNVTSSLEASAGAVYSPLVVIVPRKGEMLQVTAVLLLPVTVAVNCWLCDAASIGARGATLTLTCGGGLRFMVALADLVGSAKLVAVMVTA